MEALWTNRKLARDLGQEAHATWPATASSGIASSTA